MKWCPFLIFLFIEFNGQSQLDQRTLEVIDSLKDIAENHKDDSVRIIAYRDWDELIYISDPDLDFEINEKIIAISNHNIHKTDVSPSKRSFFYTSKSSSTNILGLVLTEKGDYNRAHDLFEQSLELAETLGDSSLMAGATNNLGMIYKIQGYPEISLKYYERSMLLDDKDDLRGKATYYNNIGLCYADMEKDQLAYKTYLKSLELSRKVGDQQNEANVLSNIGELYYFAESYDSAIIYFDSSFTINSEIGNATGIIYSTERKGISHHKMGNSKKGIEFCAQALEWAKEAGQLYNLVRCHKCLYQSYRELKVYDRALHHFEEYKYLNDSSLDQSNVEAAIQNEYQKDYEKKLLADSLEISSQQRVKEIELEADIKTQKNQRIVLYAGIAGLLAIVFLIFRSYRSKKKDNEIIAEQKKVVEVKNQEILDSINYAKRIQEAILPPDSLMASILPQTYIYYQPKDIVAGDFYWLEQIGDRIFVAVADCTGHGVPGAMVSVVCHNALNRSVREFQLKDAGKILDKTRELVIETFAKSDKDVKDGMDIAFCCWDKNTSKIQYAGANNSLYIKRSNGEIEEIKADKQPIGAYDHKKDFTSHEIFIQNGEMFLLFTDGFADQFGGEQGKKYKYKNFKNLLSRTSKLPVHEQKAKLEREFNTWKGQLDQLDDVCVMGIKF